MADDDNLSGPSITLRLVRYSPPEAERNLALSKDLAVSLPLFIPMAELDQLAWDRVLPWLSPRDVAVRTSKVSLDGC